MPYEFDGKKYEKASEHQKEWGDKLISWLNLTGTERILDLGCGDGRITETLADLVPKGHVLGVDASRGMIAVAQKKARNNLSFKLMDISLLNLSGKFDVIFSNAALHWVKDHQKLWLDVKIILSDNGVVRFNFAADGNCSNFFRIIRDAIAVDEYKPYFTGFEWPWYMPQIEEYKKIVGSLPFSEIKVWGENADRTFPDEESIVGWVNQPSIVPFIKQIDDNKKETFRNYVIERMLKETALREGGYFETFRRINVFVKN